MSRTAMIAAFAAMLAASPAAFAAQPGSAANGGHSAKTETAVQPQGVTATQLQADQIRASKLNGADVYGSDNKKVGTVKDIIIGEHGRVSALVVDVDGKNVGIGMSGVKIAMDNNNTPKLTVDKTQQQLKSQQAFNFNENKNENKASGSSTAPTIPPAGQKTR